MSLLTVAVRTVHDVRPETESQKQEPPDVIICICRGQSERHIAKAIDNGAASLADLQLCGIGDQCGSCHTSLRAMLMRASAASAAPCPVHLPEPAGAPALA